MNIKYESQVVISKLSDMDVTRLAKCIVSQSRWRFDENIHYENCDLDDPNGRIFLSESEFSSGIMSNSRLFSDEGYTFQITYEWDKDEKSPSGTSSNIPFIEWDSIKILNFTESEYIPQVILIPVKEGYVLTLEYYTDTGKIIELLSKSVTFKEARRIVGWCISHKARVYDYCFELFGILE